MTDRFPDLFETPRLTLRPVALTDAEAIFDGYAQDPEVARFTIWAPHRDLTDTVAFLELCLAKSPADARTYALIGREDGALRGLLDLRRTKPHAVEFGYVLARRWWGQGLMTEALGTIVAWALAQPDIFRIGAVCDVDNIGSARVMEKAGLNREGVLRRWLVHPNISAEPRDCYGYAKVR
ncbi:alanine acetyltransferase [Aliidongia dinghuensis]|uniref:Alanine acetyltransferase n=1 Tax=Aliidongia dinghuensis TaxID=1867774 RepID=A0A8J3E4E3_9PROT|nr:GNAT family N-acetyltransferase [Aliidongia dinghuensis]GGF26357.1 alanine acetyltransferase [Aliidongia dinghuensis]